MGCYSFLCKECGKGIKSNSKRGQDVYLFAIEDGRLVEYMRGEYDSYGSVFIDGTENDIGVRDSVEWKMGEDAYFDILFAAYDSFERFDEHVSTGIAAVHVKCHTGKIPTTASESDPMQGFGEDGELFNDFENREIP